MFDLSPLIDKLLEKDKKINQLSDFLKTVKSDVTRTVEILEPFLAKPVKEVQSSDRIAAVDGGLVSRSLYGFDFCLIRSAGVLFDYTSKRRKPKVEYYPNEFPVPELRINSLGEGFEIFSGIERMKREMELSIEIIDQLKPSILLLHGSIVPNSSYKSKRFNKEYNELSESIKLLFKTSIKNKCVLLGVVEDSQGKRFSEIVASDILSKIDNQKIPELIKILLDTKDSGLLYKVLEKGERSFVFRYSKAPLEHLVLKDLGEISMKLMVFYLKTANLDKPLRIEYLGPLEFADPIAEMLLPLTKSDTYAIPIPIIEADQRAKLLEKDAELVYQDILDKFPEERLRRDKRPF